MFSTINEGGYMNKIKNAKLELVKEYFNKLKGSDKNIYRCKVFETLDGSVVYHIKYSPTMNVVVFAFNGDVIKVTHKRRNPPTAAFILEEHSVERNEECSLEQLPMWLDHANVFLTRPSGYAKDNGTKPPKIKALVNHQDFDNSDCRDIVFMGTVESFETYQTGGFDFVRFTMSDKQIITVPKKVLQKSRPFKMGSTLIQNKLQDVQFFSPFKAEKLFEYQSE